MSLNCFPGWLRCLVLLGCVCATGAFLYLAYGVLPSDSATFAVAVLVCFYAPGSLLLAALLKRQQDPVAAAIQSTALGAALLPMIYLNLHRFGQPDWILYLVAGMFVVWLSLVVRRRWHGAVQEGKVGKEACVSLLLILAFALGVLHLSHFTDVVFTANGFGLRTTHLTETIFHQGIITAIRDTFPPESIYFSGGGDFSYYHFSMHLGVEMMHRLFHIDLNFLIYFFFPLLYFVLLLAVPYLLFRQQYNSAFVGLVVGLLLLGSDFSFVPGLLGMEAGGAPWTLYFRTTIWSLFTLNGFLPAVFVFLLAFYYLVCFCKHNDRGCLVLFCLLAFAAVGFKSSMGFHIVGAALGASAISWVYFSEQMAALRVLKVSALTFVLVALEVWVLRGGAGDNVIALFPFGPFQESLARLRLNEVSGFWYPLLFIGYVVGAFGVRLIGFIGMRRVLAAGDYPSWFLVVFVVSGFVASEMMFMGSPQRGINDAVWFSVQSLIAAWLLLGLFLVRMQARWKKGFFASAVLLVVLLAMPSTIQFLAQRFDHNYTYIDESGLDIIARLEQIPPDSIVLHPINREGPSLASNYSGRISVLNVYRSFVDNSRELQRRYRDISQFFTPKVTPAFRARILKRYNVDYVYAPRSSQRYLSRMNLLQLVQANEGFVLYRVVQ